MIQKCNRRFFIKSFSAVFALVGLKKKVRASESINLTDISNSKAKKEDFESNEFQKKHFDQKKNELELLNDRPLNAQTPPHLLHSYITPLKYFFVRNNGIVPKMALKKDKSVYKITIEGEVERPITFSFDELISKFKHYEYNFVLECGGNGRAAFYPPTKGNQWTYGAVGQAKWTGVRLKDVLTYCKIKKTAQFVAYYGYDLHLSTDESKVSISRGAHVEKAMEETSLLAFKMNGEEIPALHGFPVRLVIPGMPASVSGKWLKKIWVRDREHDGAKMTGDSYRVPNNPIKPGSSVLNSQMEIIKKMPVKSLITYPQSGKTYSYLSHGKKFLIAGKAWTSEKKIDSVYISIDYGRSWKMALVQPSSNRYAWQEFSLNLAFNSPGYYEIWSKAVDSGGHSQGMVVPGWNPKGYLNNACMRISVEFS